MNRVQRYCSGTPTLTKPSSDGHVSELAHRIVRDSSCGRGGGGERGGGGGEGAGGMIMVHYASEMQQGSLEGQTIMQQRHRSGFAQHQACNVYVLCRIQFGVGG